MASADGQPLQAVFISPTDPRYPYPAGGARILRLRCCCDRSLPPRSRFRLASGLTILPREPCLLCVTSDGLDQWRSSHHHIPFHAIPHAEHGVPRLSLRLVNLTDTEQRYGPEDPRTGATGALFCAVVFGLRLPRVTVVTVALRRAAPPDDDPEPVTPLTAARLTAQVPPHSEPPPEWTYATLPEFDWFGGAFMPDGLDDEPPPPPPAEDPEPEPEPEPEPADSEAEAVLDLAPLDLTETDTGDETAATETDAEGMDAATDDPSDHEAPVDRRTDPAPLADPADDPAAAADAPNEDIDYYAVEYEPVDPWDDPIAPDAPVLDAAEFGLDLEHVVQDEWRPPSDPERRPLLRLATEHLRWVPFRRRPPSEQTASSGPSTRRPSRKVPLPGHYHLATLTASVPSEALNDTTLQLPAILRVSPGLRLIASSEPRVAVLWARYHPSHNRLEVRLRYEGPRRPPAGITLILVLARQNPDVTLTGGEHPCLRPLAPNGYRVHWLPHDLRLGSDEVVKLTLPCSYQTDQHLALFIPYDVPHCVLSLVHWRPRQALAIHLRAATSVTLTPWQPLGEVRFFHREQLTTLPPIVALHPHSTSEPLTGNQLQSVGFVEDPAAHAVTQQMLADMHADDPDWRPDETPFPHENTRVLLWPLPVAFKYESCVPLTYSLPYGGFHRHAPAFHYAYPPVPVLQVTLDFVRTQPCDEERWPTRGRRAALAAVRHTPDPAPVGRWPRIPGYGCV